MAAIQRFLLVRFSSLGDVVLTTPLLRALKQRFATAEITFVTREVYSPLVRHNPAVKRVVTLAPGESVRALARELGDTDFDLAIDLHGSIRSLALRQLVRCRWTGYDKRRLQRALLIHFGIDRYADRRSVAERYFTALKGLAVVPDGAPPEVFVSAADRELAGDYAGRATIALAPGARHATKRWPTRKWSELAALLAGSGHEVLVLGQAGEDTIPGLSAFPGLFGAPLGVVAAILEASRLVVANDSGLMHLATAVRTPVIALFGPTVEQFGFFPYSEAATVIEQDLPCRPCSHNGSSRCPLGHHRCLHDIMPEQVAALVAAA